MTNSVKLLPLLRTGATTLALAGLTACASGGKSLEVAGKGANYRDAVSAYTDPGADPNGLDPVAAAAFWGAQYDKDPNDPQAAVKYSAALRKMGSIDQAVNVMSKVVARHSENPDVDFEMGKALVEAGRAFEAVRYLEEAAAARETDWRVISAYGVALDQIGEHKLARTKYDFALTLAPGSVQLLNNKGLSFAMDGDLTEAVRVLRVAATSPGADARVRQNLALTLALKGDMFEAERLARSDLPPQIADQNIDYFRSLVVQPAYWQDFAASDGIDVPTFEAAPAPTPVSTLAVPSPSEPKPVAAPTPLFHAEGVTKTSADADTPVFIDMTDDTDDKAQDEDLAPSIKDAD